MLDEVLEGDGVHDGAEHSHVVRPGAVHSAPLQLRTPEEVASADDDGDLHPVLDGDGDLGGDPGQDVGVEADRSPAEHLAGQFEQDPSRTVLVVVS